MEVRNRIKGLDLIDIVPEEVWMELHDLVQEAVIKTILKIKKCKKTKWLPEESLQIAVNRREAKGKGDKIYSFACRVPKIARRDNKAFLSDQCKEIEEKIEWETRDLFKKIRDTKGTFHVKMAQ